jgi:hypothetical protein
MVKTSANEETGYPQTLAHQPAMISDLQSDGAESSNFQTKLEIFED